MKKIAPFLSTLSLLIFLTACQKSEDPNLTDNFNSIKVYDDTLASVNNLDAKIVAGSGRLYMTYGRGGWETTPIGYISYVGFSVNYSINLMATDNEGKLLWRVPLPKADINIGGILETNDGCLVVAKDNFAWFNNTIYFFAFDRNGQLVSRDSTVFPSSISTNNYLAITSMSAIKAANGNIIVYGNFRDNNRDLAFACEYTTNGILQWGKPYYFFPMAPDFGNQQAYFTDCTTSDDGYLFIGSANSDSWAMPGENVITVFKTDASGDSLWTKMYHIHNLGWNTSLDIFPLVNGNNRFYFNSNDPTSILNIFEINSMGDSVNSVALALDQNIATILLPESDGGSFVLMNTHGSMIYSGGGDGVFNQTNSMHMSLSSGLSIIEKDYFQTQTTDFITCACKTSDGKTACFGTIQSYNRNYYVPELIILN